MRDLEPYDSYSNFSHLNKKKEIKVNLIMLPVDQVDELDDEVLSLKDIGKRPKKLLQVINSKGMSSN